MFKSLRNALIAGLFLILPITVTIWLVIWLIKTVGAPVTDLIFIPITQNIDSAFWHTTLGKGVMNLCSTLIVLTLITIIGFLSQFFLGKIAINLSEAFICKIPLANSIYKTVKQIVDTFSKQNKSVFQKVVLVEFPHKGVYSVGFLTSDTKGEIHANLDCKREYVFIPTTPNPTSGFLMLFPEAEVIKLNMTVSEGFKLIVSFGAVIPDWKACELIEGAKTPQES